MKISKVISIHVYFLQERQFPHRQGLTEKGKELPILQSLYTKDHPPKCTPSSSYLVSVPLNYTCLAICLVPNAPYKLVIVTGQNFMSL